MNYNFKNYPVLTELKLENESRIVIFSSCYSEDKQFPEILGREVFLFDKNGIMIWQIDAPQGVARIFDESIGEYVSQPYDWYFSGLRIRDGKYLAERFDGDVFELDMATGKATYVYWTK
jgi:outer membrane protein assembly factor BamB